MVNLPIIVISNLNSMINEPIKISAMGMQPREAVTFHLIKKINEERYLASWASFRADQHGKVALDELAPDHGTYRGIDGMALFWSMKPVTKNVMTQYFDNTSIQTEHRDELSPQALLVLLEMNDKVVAHQVITRHWMSDDIRKLNIREAGLTGSFFYSQDMNPRPAIMVVGGSEGGINEKTAALLASHGFTVLSLGYFGLESLPKQLRDIPLETIQTALTWLHNRPEVQAGGIGIHGTSRGSELALWSATLFPDIHAAVSLSGSAVSFCGIVPWTDQPTLPPAWTYQGQPLPYLQPDNPIELARECKDMWTNRNGNPFRTWHDGLAKNTDLVEAATIPLERMNGELLMISGLADESWNSAYLSEQGFKRKTAFRKDASKHLIYDGAGHYIGIPYLRAVSSDQGNQQALAQASVESWKETIRFFKRVLCK